MNNNTPSTGKANPSPKNYTLPLLIIGFLFFIFGFVTWVNSVLIAFFKQAFTLNMLQSNLVAFSFFIAYTVMAVPSSYFLKWTGFKKGMSAGLGMMACGSFSFVLAATANSYGIFLTGLFMTGIGLTVLQTAVNPYVTILGNRESAAQRFNFMGVANKSGGVASQFILGGMLLAGSNSISGTGILQKAVQPYSIISGILLLFAVLIFFSRLPEVSEEQDDNGIPESNPKTSIFQFRNLVLGVLAIFCAVACEVVAADTIIVYGKTLKVGPEMQQLFLRLGIDPSIPVNDLPNYLTVFTLVGAITSYVLGIFLIPKFIPQHKALKYGAIFGMVVTTVAVFGSGFTSVFCVALTGIAIAPMWPAIWPLALNRVGKFTKTGSALLIMGVLGGAVVPLIYGRIADAFNPTIAYSILIPLYLYNLYYAQVGHKKLSW